MTQILILVCILIFLELFESSWQKAPTLYGMMKNNYAIFKKNIFSYFLLNPTFIYSIFLCFYLSSFNFWLSSIVVVKFVDISFRLHIISKMNYGVDLNELLPMDVTISNFFRYFNILLYPMLLVFALLN